VARLKTPAGRVLTLTLEMPDLTWQPVKARYSPAFNQIVETTRLEVSGAIREEQQPVLVVRIEAKS
jgi:hypothetical protein